MVDQDKHRSLSSAFIFLFLRVLFEWCGRGRTCLLPGNPCLSFLFCIFTQMPFPNCVLYSKEARKWFKAAYLFLNLTSRLLLTGQRQPFVFCLPYFAFSSLYSVQLKPATILATLPIFCARCSLQLCSLIMEVLQQCRSY